MCWSTQRWCKTEDDDSAWKYCVEAISTCMQLEGFQSNRVLQIQPTMDLCRVVLALLDIVCYWHRTYIMVTFPCLRFCQLTDTLLVADFLYVCTVCIETLLVVCLLMVQAVWACGICVWRVHCCGRALLTVALCCCVRSVLCQFICCQSPASPSVTECRSCWPHAPSTGLTTSHSRLVQTTF